MSSQNIAENKFASLILDWEDEGLKLGKVLSDYRSPVGDKYDSIIHIDGTRENLAKFFLLKNVYQLQPLAITFNHHHYTNQQKYNIKRALELFDLDHVMFTARVSVIDRFKQRFPESFERLKTQGVISFLIRIAVKYEVPLIVWEKSLGKFGSESLTKVSADYAKKNLQVLDLKKFIGNDFSAYDLNPYRLPESEEIEDANLVKLQIEDFPGLNNERVQKFLNENFKWDDSAIEPDTSFWIGSPDDWDPEKDGIRHTPTRYEKLAEVSEQGQPLYDKTLRYCTRCCMPETAEALEFDEMGICQPCRSSEQKMHINWIERQQKLVKILDKYKSVNEDHYDCMVPISGGKDSTFQLYVLTKIFNRKVLAVTYSHNWYSKTGRYNLMNAIKVFDVDHAMLTPRRKVINKLARKSLHMIGDSCWHCHAGVGAFPLQAAVKFDVPLLIWGESVAENDGRATYENPIVFDRDYFTKISARFYAEEMVDDDINKLDINPYILPSREAIEGKSIVGIHLGDYMFWDDERQMEFVRDHFGWREDKVEGTYKGYKSVECIMAGIHDYTKFIKRGYGRGTDHASQDVRTGLLTKEEGFELAKKYDTERPQALDYYLKITGYSEEEFEEVLKRKRDEKASRLP